jgi:hypothetical protein
MDTFENALTTMFAQAEPAFREFTVKRYMARATEQFEQWSKLLSGEEPPKDRRYHDRLHRPDYVGVHGGTYSLYWDGMVANFKAGKFYCNIDRAVKDANDAVDCAKTHFVSKQSKKLKNATKLRTDSPSLEGHLHFNGLIVTGTLKVTFPNGDWFTIELDMIVNHRYSRGHKSFYQFPARFKECEIAGQRQKVRLSEKWMSEHFKA